jgi:hypothetical protein
MTNKKLKSFELLKKKVETTFRQHSAACQDSIHHWKGKQISTFQEDLSKEVGGYVSEKWFYTHLKVSENEKLPRIDMLNLLAQYVGALGWDDFVLTNPLKEETKLVKEERVLIVGEPLNKTAKKIAANMWMLIFGLLFIVSIMIALSFFRKENSYRFCVVDMDDASAINYTTIEAFWLKANESPLPLKVDSAGCIEMPIQSSKEIKLEIQALYYKSKTVVRRLDNTKEGETIKLEKDDYALMIHYFSNNKMEDWNKRREQLALMISNNARIVQINNKTGGGMALYNKEEFINKMTMPIKSLKNIEVLETKYQGEQIVEIRFFQKNN